MLPSTLRTVWQGFLVATIAAGVTAMLYSQWWKACCTVADDVIGLALLPGYLIAWIVGGGPHGAGQLAFYFGILVEFLLIWWLSRLIIRKVKKLRGGGMSPNSTSESNARNSDARGSL